MSNIRWYYVVYNDISSTQILKRLEQTEMQQLHCLYYNTHYTTFTIITLVFMCSSVLELVTLNLVLHQQIQPQPQCILK